MTAREKKVFALGAGLGIVAAVLAAGTWVARSMHVFASQPTTSMTADAGRSARAEAPKEPQQGTQPGATVQLTPDEMVAAGVQIADLRTANLKTNIDAFGHVEQPE